MRAARGSSRLGSIIGTPSTVGSNAADRLEEDHVGRRTAAFLAAAFGGAIELFGALYGQGVLGHGMLFGLAGDATRTDAAMIGFVFGTTTIVGAVGLMLVRETRWLSALIIVASIAGTLVAGLVYGVGAALALVGGIVAARIDRTAPLS